MMIRCMTRCVTLVLLLAAASIASPQEPAKSRPAAPAVTEKVPTVEQVLDAYFKAVGGVDKMRQFSSRVMKGSFAAPAMGVTGTAEIYKAAPDKMFSLVHIESVGDFAQGYDGQVGWSSDPNSGFRELAGEELSDSRRQSQFYHELHFSELYPVRRVIGKVKVDEKDAWVVEAAAPEAPPEKFYFDVVSGLMVRHDSVQITAQSRVSIEQYFSDYTLVDGLRLPTTVRHIDPQITWEVHFTDIAQNVPIEASKFAKPTAQ